MRYNKQFTFKNPIHPWETLKELLEEYKITQKELSERLWMSEKHISGLIQWKNNISPELALKLESIFRISAWFWNNLQTSYNEDISRIQEKEDLQKEIGFIEKYSYTSIQKLGFVVKTKDKLEKVKSLRNFFWVASLFQIPKISNNAFAFRKYDKFNVTSGVFSAWLRVWEKIWDTIEVWDFSKAQLQGILKELKEMTRNEQIDIKKIEILLSSVWVRFVFVSSFPKNPVVWVTRKYKSNPLIQISDRWKQMDIFWFTLFHEIWHLIHHYSAENTIFIDYENKNSDTMEQEANDFARNFLINIEEYNKEILKSKINVEKIANISNTSISIVAWSICHDLWDKDKNIWKDTSRFRSSTKLVNLQY